MLQVPPQLALQLALQVGVQLAPQVAAQLAAQVAAQLAPQVAPQLAAHEPSQLLTMVGSGHSSQIDGHLYVRVTAPPAAVSNSVSVKLRIEVGLKPSLVFLLINSPYA